MWLLALTAVFLCITVDTAGCVIYNQTRSERSDTILHCNKNVSGNWSKGADDDRVNVQTPHDPDQRIILLSNSSLVIKNLSVSDSGIYFCNSDPAVNLTVTPVKESETMKSKAKKREKNKVLSDSSALFLVVAALLAGVGLVLILVRINKTQSPEPCVPEHYYETIDDSVPAPAPGHQKPCKTVYALADDPSKLAVVSR